jgi:type IV fimbrial biogenesis protein FimT
MNTRQHGFTLWELLMTLLVAGILFGVGVPNLMEFQRNGLMTGAANDLVTAALMARAEAVKRQAPVGWCMTNDMTAATPTCLGAGFVNAPWTATRGYVVWVDENDNFDANGNRILTDATDGNAAIDAGELVIRRTPHPGGRILVSTTCSYASFTPTGALRQVGGACVPVAPGPAATRWVLFCDDRGRRASTGNLSSARAVRIDRPGRANVLQETADVNAAIVFLGPIGAVTCP